MRVASRQLVVVAFLTLVAVSSSSAESTPDRPADFKSGLVIPKLGSKSACYSVLQAVAITGDLCKICATSGTTKHSQRKTVNGTPQSPKAQAAVSILPPGLWKTRDLCFKLTGNGLSAPACATSRG